jgi:uncharacterized membrane protein
MDQLQLEQGLKNKYGTGKNGFIAFLKDARVYGLGATLGGALAASNVNAAVDVAPIVANLTTDGTAAITAVGTALLALAGIAVIFKWVKAAFFS